MGVTVRKKKKDGPYYLFIHHNGKKRSMVAGMNKAEALKKAQKAEEALAYKKLGIVDDEKETFGFYCNKWIKDYAPLHCSAATLSDYQGIVVNHLKIAIFWDTPAKEITKSIIEDFLTKKRRNKALSTVKHIKTCISQSLDRAVGQPGVPVNPCITVKLRENRRAAKKAKATKKGQYYSEDQVEKLLETFKQHDPYYYLLALLMVRTGCRCSEVAALNWDDVDLDNRTLTIKKAYVRGKLIELTKSGEDRDVDLTPFLTSELRKAKLASGGSGFLFTNKAGGRIDFNNFRRRHFNKIVAKAKLPVRRLHDLRHTYASILLKKCRDILYVQKQLGHSKPSITLDVYGHVLKDNSPGKMVDILEERTSASRAPQIKKELTIAG
ncbi:tyrosine-type recombinase/integrase [Desulfosediminicola flagellatus]|uniref:tyrosine-type recombinase/integrase n=1 Tax=Desulfosediminicola flagellatus TaxID=2569541 RepID=UPI0010AB85ED|nr:site-specific integrase [Desulfosediminicola flagellatus]